MRSGRRNGCLIRNSNQKHEFARVLPPYLRLLPASSDLPTCKSKCQPSAD